MSLLDDATQSYYERTVTVVACRDLLHRIAQVARRSRGHDVEGALYTLNQALAEVELEAWRNLFMLALRDEQARKQAKDLAAERFFGEDSAVIQHLHGGDRPGRWSSDVEDRLRQEIESAFGKL